jgi:hypothetical protein
MGVLREAIAEAMRAKTDKHGIRRGLGWRTSSRRRGGSSIRRRRRCHTVNRFSSEIWSRCGSIDHTTRHSFLNATAAMTRSGNGRTWPPALRARPCCAAARQSSQPERRTAISERDAALAAKDALVAQQNQQLAWLARWADDREGVRADGFGVAVWDFPHEAVEFHCYPRFVTEVAGIPQEFPGWPVIVPLEKPGE